MPSESLCCGVLAACHARVVSLCMSALVYQWQSISGAAIPNTGAIDVS